MRLAYELGTVHDGMMMRACCMCIELNNVVDELD